jgi:hypothetical protein
MNMELDKNHLDQVERDIRPPMRKAITIPVENVFTDMPGNAVVIYVAEGAFSQTNISDEVLQRIASKLELQLESV